MEEEIKLIWIQRNTAAHEKGLTDLCFYQMLLAC